jgi:hypothetical protein
MTSTYNDIRAAIEGRVAAEMQNPTQYPVAFQNVPFTPPNNSSWVKCLITFGDNAYATLVEPSPGFNRHNGLVLLNIFSPVGVGPSENYDIGERLKNIFDRQTFSGIIFDAASGPAQVLPGQPESFFQTRLSITFEAYLE